MHLVIFHYSICSSTLFEGEKVSLSVKTLDAEGKPTSAIVGITVTDDAVLEMVEKRKQAPRLLAMV